MNDSQRYRPRRHNPFPLSVEHIGRSDLARWLWLASLVGFFTLAYFLALTASEADIEAQSPATLSPRATKSRQTRVPDPCGLAAVDCPGEATQGRVEPRVIYATVYTYQAVPEQTDGDPCTTASGLDLCDPVLGLPPFGVVANNCLTFGTEVSIRGQQYFVHDRMNARHGCNTFDILIHESEAPWTWQNEPVTVL